VDPDYVPERGDFVWVTFTPQAGHEQAGRRPALVLSPSSYNGKSGLAILSQITNQVKGYPFESVIPDGLAVSGVVLADHVRSIDWRARRIAYECAAPEELVKDVLQKSRTLLQ
jgi:mRNA interferase MazF